MLTKVNEFRIAFIIAVNNEAYYEECVHYINRLHLPKGYEVDILAIRQADSMCAAYNLGMQSSDAKYKVYLHQDVFIRNREFIADLLEIFKRESSVGMVGMIGGIGMPKTGVTYQAWDTGLVDCRDADMAYYMTGRPMDKDTYVDAVDGLLIATQYDIPWREDLFPDFDFYDVSQSFEMRRAGYRIVVPYQSKPWVIHDSSFAKLSRYDASRQTCLQEYAEFLTEDGGFEFEYQMEWDSLSGELTALLKQMLNARDWQQVRAVIAQYRKGQMKDSTLEMIGIMSDIWAKEKEGGISPSFFAGTDSYQAIYERYIRVRFLLRRMELEFAETEYQELEEEIKAGSISYAALLELLLHAAVDKCVVLKKLSQIFEKCGQTEHARAMQEMCTLMEGREIPLVVTKRVATEQVRKEQI